MADLAQEARRLLSHEAGLGVWFRHACRRAPAENAGAVVFFVRLKPILDQKVVIIAQVVAKVGPAVMRPVSVHDAHPGLKAVLGHHLVTQVPFAHVSPPVVRTHHLRDAGRLRLEGDVVADAPGGVWVQAGYDRRTRRRADRLGNVGIFEDQALRGQPVQVGGLHELVAVGSQRIKALLIRQDEYQI